jgi:hypothetical protein
MSSTRKPPRRPSGRGRAPEAGALSGDEVLRIVEQHSRGSDPAGEGWSCSRASEGLGSDRRPEPPER